MEWGTILMVAVLVAAMYFIMIRPAKKQQAAKQKLMDSLGVGSRVMLTSGIYGTIRHLGDKQAIIEISPGVDLTVVRAAVAKVTSSEEEEFEYSETEASPAADPIPEDWPVLAQDPADSDAAAPDGFQLTADAAPEEADPTEAAPPSLDVSGKETGPASDR
ncbi:MAG: preprotein translocase subunit YajC [Propionibacteriaceae bacterium]|jgi:preprotein translocase subunit YajC|nr:preprotein translocase subunit YajC [Propionibacteriaceae bacterium]